MKKILNGVIVADNAEADLSLINENTLEPLAAEDVYAFKIQICDNDIDRVGDKMTDNFLQQISDKAAGVPGLMNHEWSTDTQMSRTYAAEVVEDTETVVSTGEPRKYVLARAYTLNKFGDFVDKIKSGILKEVSVGFESLGDKCSICGCEMHKFGDDRAECENRHVAGNTYDGKLCYNIIDNLNDLLEWSFVAVPCQRNAKVVNKSKQGGLKMTKAEFMVRRLMHSKAFKEVDDEMQEKIKLSVRNGSGKDDEQQVTDEDIRILMDENDELRDKNIELTKQLEETNKQMQKAKKEMLFDSEMGKYTLVSPQVKELLKNTVDWDSIEVDGDKVKGMDKVIGELQKNYADMFVSEEETERIGGHNEPDGDEAGVLYVNKEAPDGDEGKIMVSSKLYPRASTGVGGSNRKKKEYKTAVYQPKYNIGGMPM